MCAYKYTCVFVCLYICECMYVCVCTWERTQCLCRLPAAGPQTLLRVESAAQPTLWHSQFRFNQIFPSDNNISWMSFWVGLSITQVFDYSHFLSFRMNSKLRCQHTAILYNSERKMVSTAKTLSSKGPCIPLHPLHSIAERQSHIGRICTILMNSWQWQCVI